MKESLLKNKNLKEIDLNDFKDQTNKLNNEFKLVYKLLKLTNNQFNLDFSNNIYFNSDDIILKLNYLKCFIDEIDYLFFNFHHFDLIFIFQK
jgi:benzoyl-CoA reductase/2-hydroxyglutaryl-CoA dehydratase subunit BcrC/BadD/HgdB